MKAHDLPEFDLARYLPRPWGVVHTWPTRRETSV